MDPWGFMSPFLLFPTLLGLFLLILTFFPLPGKDFAELHRQSDWFLCSHRPLQMLVIMSRCCCWRGACGRAVFCYVLALSCAPGKKWSSDSHALKIVALKNITLRPGMVTSRNLELVLQIHFLMKRNVKALIVSGQWDKRAERLGKSRLPSINLLLFPCSLFYSRSIKLSGIKKESYVTEHALWCF